ncbi:MAG: dTDP-4-dehydrorhamnose 3,5-epimerase [Cyclobacteriaceae bacterium]
MDFIATKFKSAFEIQPRIFEDERGYFFESFNQESFNKHVPNTQFVQDNQSFSTKGVLRGLHFQKPPYAQGKLVRVIQGKVLDVIVDLREESSTFGEWDSFILDAKKSNMLFVPEGFAHGFSTIEDAIFVYKCTNGYSKISEGGILWNDEQLNIDWGIEAPIVSEKDCELPTFKELTKEMPIFSF